MNKQLTLRDKLYDIIFEADTFAGKLFDIILIVSIILSVIVVMLDSVQDFHDAHSNYLAAAEWGFTILFSIEYILRLYCIRNTLHYATSFYGIVDLLAILPAYLSLLFPGAQHLMVIRVLRVLRIFRVLKIIQFIGEANLLLYVLRESKNKIIVFLFSILTMVVILGSMMYLIESPYNAGFTSIPAAIYWAIVTLTTVGYGDISPETTMGQILASVIMILGYSVIAVPSGFVTAELSRARKSGLSSRVCSSCSAEGHDKDAIHCKYCGFRLEKEEN